MAGISLDDNLSNFALYYGSSLDEKKREELYYHIGDGIRKPSSFLPRKERKKAPTVKKVGTDTFPVRVIIGGAKDIPHQMAQCCSPRFSDDIVAVLRTGGKCMIHKSDCGSLSRVNPDRLLSAYWQTNEKGKITSFSLLFHDVPGLVSRVTKIFYDMGINIIDMNVSNLDNTTCRIFVHIEIPNDDASFLDRLLERIRLHVPEYLLHGEDFFDKKK